MRVADYVFRFLADRGATHVFLVTGGGAMHLDDALGREPRLRYVCNMHEQACAIAAEGYARISGRPGVVCVTTGPGGTNAITGVMGAWVDSVPMLVISGQVKRETTIDACPGAGLRQLGDQEINILDLVRPITKFAASVRDPRRIRALLETAWQTALAGRPGPVWLDIPLDVQGAEIDPDTLPAADRPAPAPQPPADANFNECFRRLTAARRPVIVAGGGIDRAGARALFRELTGRLRIPVLTAISGVDLIASDSPWFFGRPGIIGARAANFILQNSDLLLVIGCRMNIRVIGYAFETVARAAFKVMVDADPAELRKPTFRPDLGIHADAGVFLRRLADRLPADGLPEQCDWLDYCRRLRRDYPTVAPDQRERTDFVSSYHFPELLAAELDADAILVTGNGTAYTSTFQVMPIRPEMRMFANLGCAAMGYDLPAAIGAACAGGGRQVVCITGDGSIQMNLAELQTLLNARLPVKIFVYNNDGYLSIKLTQTAFFGGRLTGADPSSGVGLPDMVRIAEAYGIPAFRLRNHAEARRLLPEILHTPGPVLCEVLTDPREQLGPKAASRRLPDGRMVSAPLEDMAPFLPREEFRRNMLIPPVSDED